jgi:hypothetical protein
MAVTILAAIVQMEAVLSFDSIRVTTFEREGDLLRPVVIGECLKSTSRSKVSFLSEVFDALQRRVTSTHGDFKIVEWFTEVRSILKGTPSTIYDKLQSLAKQLLPFHVVLEINVDALPSASEGAKQNWFVTANDTPVAIRVDDMPVLPARVSARSRVGKGDTNTSLCVAYVKEGTLGVKRNTHGVHFTPLLRKGQAATSLKLIEDGLLRAFVIRGKSDTLCVVCGELKSENAVCARLSLEMKVVSKFLEGAVPSPRLSAAGVNSKTRRGSRLMDLKGPSRGTRKASNRGS